MIKTTFTLALSIQFLLGIELIAQDFPIYQPLPVIALSPQEPIQTWEMAKLKEPDYYQQEQDRIIISKFMIETATVDGKDYSQHYINNNACLVIYTNKGSKDIYFANYMPVSKSISTGVMISPELITKPKTSTSDKQQTSIFKWSFSNSYDNNKGIANVHLLQIYHSGGTLFSCTISSKGTLAKYTGHMESIN